MKTDKNVESENDTDNSFIDDEQNEEENLEDEAMYSLFEE